MQLALLSGAIPRTCARGPKVRLQKGKWKLECNGLIDSFMFITLSFPSEDSPYNQINIARGVEFELIETSIAQVDFQERGNEKHVTILAEKIV